MIQRLGQRCAEWARRWMPEPFIFAILLTILTLVLGLIFTKSTFKDMLLHWGEGFFQNLTFGMQMCLILVTGHALANSRPVRRLIDMISRVPDSTRSATVIVAFSACVASLIHWGLGVIVGALMAREVGRSSLERGLRFHYPLLGAAGYMGLMVWHGGLSGSAPLQAATPGQEVVAGMGVIPVGATLGSPLNLVMAGVLSLVIIIFCFLLSPRDESGIITAEAYLESEVRKEEPEEETGPARRIENSLLLSLFTGAFGLGFVALMFAEKGFHLDLNIVNFVFLFLGIIFQKTPINYVRAIADGARSVAGIILQFPFYFGIQGMMAHSGLVELLATGFVSISNSVTLPVFTFLSAGIVNIFVPSGGGQWIVQGPVMIKASQALGVSIPKTIMAISYGDEWTNMVQPFWAIPLLGITGLKVGEIIGYSMLLCAGVAVVYALGLVVLPA
jgi:short-chain fatty acids transporter